MYLIQPIQAHSANSPISGSQLRALHLLQSPLLDNLITAYNQKGDNIIISAKIKFALTDHEKQLGSVHINDKQRFENVPATAWNFPIGGYLPAQKWLKERNGRKLNHDDITHYQKIIVALTETNRLMQKIDTAMPTY